MEINSSVNLQTQGAKMQPANIAAPASKTGAADRPNLPLADTKAAPKVPEFKASDIDKAVADLQAYIDDLDRDLSFSRDESINRSIITVRDANTNQLVRQIPAEEVVEIARQIKEDLDAKRAGMLIRGEV